MPSVFLISLASAEREAALMELRKLKLRNVKIIEAFDGKAKLSFEDPELQKLRGTFGCLLSHLSIYQYCVDNDIARAMIFEDDLLVEDAERATLALAKPAARLADVCCFSRIANERLALRTHAYVVSLAAMRIFLAEVPTMQVEPRLIHSDRLITYCIHKYPRLRYHFDTASTMVQDKSLGSTIDWRMDKSITAETYRTLQQALRDNPLKITQTSEKTMTKTREMYKGYFDKLRDNIGDSPVVYIPNQGNWGDSLIRAGTFAFFAAYGIKYKVLPLRNLGVVSGVKNRVAVFAGSGAFCKYWSHGLPISLRASEKFQRVVVLPSTFQLSPPLKDNVAYWRRDDYLSRDNCPTSRLCPDMAMFLDRSDYSEALKGIQPAGTGYFFRTDAESAGSMPLRADNYDISSKGSQDKECAPFVQAVESFERIATDRLHVGIVAKYILGKGPVWVADGAYPKASALLATW